MSTSTSTSAECKERLTELRAAKLLSHADDRVAAAEALDVDFDGKSKAGEVNDIIAEAIEAAHDALQTAMRAEAADLAARAAAESHRGFMY